MKLKKSYVVASALLISALAYARPPTSYDIAYYADASMTTQVGGGWFTCTGQTTTYGEVTPYEVISNEESC